MTINIPKGSNTLISASRHDAIVIRLHCDAPESYELDASAFMLNANGVVPNDDSMIFFNQPSSPDDAVHYYNTKQIFTLNLNKLDPAIQKIAFTLTIYEGVERRQVFKNINQAFIQVFKEKDELVRYELSGKELSQETSLIFAELYLKKDQWKFRAIGQGFNGGLAALCQHFGVNIEEEQQTAIPSIAEAEKIKPAHEELTPSENKLKNTPSLLALAKQAHASLEKANLIQHKAKVAVCLDISNSMKEFYNNGDIQHLAEKLLALGCQFDSDRKIDVFLFGSRAYHYLEEMAVNNFPEFTQRLLERYPLENGTCYGKAMKLIRNFYFPLQITADKLPINQADTPVYVIFITAGDTTDLEESKRQAKGSSYEALFWQFIAIDKTTKSSEDTEFAFLKSLTGLPKRHTENISFFRIENFEKINDSKFYDLLLTQYPSWLKSAKEKQILR